MLGTLGMKRYAHLMGEDATVDPRGSMSGSPQPEFMTARRPDWNIEALIASLMASTLIEPTLGVGFGRRCEGAIVDGAGREGVAAVNTVAETPAER